MIYELREYVATEGNADRLHARFADHTVSLFARHGLDVVGFWTEAADDGRIVYLLRFADEDAQQDAWQAFYADPEWQAVKAASEADGPIVAEIHKRNLTAVPYWDGAAR